MQRRDGDAARVDRGEVGPGLVVEARVGAVDPVAAALVLVLGGELELVAVDALAQAGHFDAVWIAGGDVDVQQRPLGQRDVVELVDDAGGERGRGREVEDVATAVFQFDRGTCGALTVAHAAREPQDTLAIFFSEGSIHIPVLNEGTMRVVSSDGERIEQHANANNIHQPLIEDFARAVLENREPVVTGEIGRAVAVVEERIYRT